MTGQNDCSQNDCSQNDCSQDICSHADCRQNVIQPIFILIVTKKLPSAAAGIKNAPLLKKGVCSRLAHSYF